MMFVALGALGGFACGLAYSSLFEWTLHKYVMHRPFLGLRYPFKAHALTHHRVFDWDESYWLQREEDTPLVTFAWWNAPVLIGMNLPIMSAAAWLVGGGWFTPVFWGTLGGEVAAITTYYFLYEYLHFCMHVRGERWFMKTAWFRWIDDHHRMHHKRPTSNLNVVMPLADYLFRTRKPGLAPVSRLAAEAVESGR